MLVWNITAISTTSLASLSFQRNSEKDLISLQFFDLLTGNMHPIVKADLAKICLRFAYYRYHKQEHQHLCTSANILAINQDNFNTWREDYLDVIHSPIATLSPAPSTPLAQTPTHDTPRLTTDKVSISTKEIFKCSIKRDLFLFLVMKQSSQFWQWKIHNVSLAQVWCPLLRCRIVQRLLILPSFAIL